MQTNLDANNHGRRDQANLDLSSLTLSIPRGVVLENSGIFIQQMNNCLVGEELIDFRRFPVSSECSPGVMLELFTAQFKVELFCCFSCGDGERKSISLEMLRPYQRAATFGLTHLGSDQGIIVSLIPKGPDALGNNGKPLGMFKIHCLKGVVSQWNVEPDSE